MTTGQIIRLALQVLVFLAWAALCLRAIRTLQSRAHTSGGAFSAQVKQWLSSEEDKQDRKTLFFLTFVLIAMNAINLLGVEG